MTRREGTAAGGLGSHWDNDAETKHSANDLALLKRKYQAKA
jgi:hypothetical protein